MKSIQTRARAATSAFAILALIAAACEPPIEDGDEIPPQCQDDIIVNIIGDDTEEVTRLGSIKLLERRYASGAATTTVVAAKFGDFSQSTGSSQEGIGLGGNCIGLTGQPVRSDKHCEYTTISCEENADCAEGVDCREYDRLVVDGVSIDGLADGSVALDQQGVGAYVKAGLSRLFSDSNIDIHVDGAADPHTFVNEDPHLIGIPAPRFIDVTAPDLSGGSSVGREDLFIEWTPGEDPDEIVFIDVVAEHISSLSADTKTSVKVSCAAFNDGCQTIWDTSLDWMLRPEPGWRLGETITIIIGRRSQMTVDLSEHAPDTELTATLSAEVYGEMTP